MLIYNQFHETAIELHDSMDIPLESHDNVTTPVGSHDSVATPTDSGWCSHVH